MKHPFNNKLFLCPQCGQAMNEDKNLCDLCLLDRNGVLIHEADDFHHIDMLTVLCIHCGEYDFNIRAKEEEYAVPGK